MVLKSLAGATIYIRGHGSTVAIQNDRVIEELRILSVPKALIEALVKAGFDPTGCVIDAPVSMGRVVASEDGPAYEPVCVRNPVSGVPK